MTTPTSCAACGGAGYVLLRRGGACVPCPRCQPEAARTPLVGPSTAQVDAMWLGLEVGMVQYGPRDWPQRRERLPAAEVEPQRRQERLPTPIRARLASPAERPQAPELRIP